MELPSTKPHLCLLCPSSHLTFMVALGKRLLTYQNVKVTVFTTCFLESAAKISSMVRSVQTTDTFNVVQLPPADISGLISPTQTGFSALSTVVRVSKPAFRSAISALETPPTALIVHAYAVDCLGIADELKIPKFVYLCSHAWYLALLLHMPILDQKVQGDSQKLKEPLELPGCTPVRVEDLPDPILIQTKNNYDEFIRIAMEIPKADGILVNTWEDLQPAALADLRDHKLLGSVAKAPIFPVGPITCKGDAVSETSELFEWMNKQPIESVLLVCFGSMGVLSLEQTMELAWGLEMSQQRFIWVVRPPMTKTGYSFDPKHGNINDMPSYLPEGFVSRTRERGLLVPQWAPQVEILSHPSCGGFLTHCGWHSILESISFGLPMIAWPLYAEQRMNATMLAELGVVVRSRTTPTEGVVGREEIETMIKKVFVDEEGQSMRGRVKELKESAEKAWIKGGSSYNALAEVVKQLLN